MFVLSKDICRFVVTKMSKRNFSTLKRNVPDDDVIVQIDHPLKSRIATLKKEKTIISKVCSSPKQTTYMTIMAINIHGLNDHKLDYIKDYMSKKNISLAFLSETWKGPKYKEPCLIFHKGCETSKETGRFYYGIGIILNEKQIKKSDISLKTIHSLSFDIYKTIRVIYLPPKQKSSREIDWYEKAL
jgi:hypothetical protein